MENITILDKDYNDWLKIFYKLFPSTMGIAQQLVEQFAINLSAPEAYLTEAKTHIDLSFKLGK